MSENVKSVQPKKDANKEEKAAYLWALRHSSEHVLTMAMEQIYGKDEQGQPYIVKAMGPATNDGF